MTKVQVSYWTYRENKRHNTATELQAQKELEEAKRHNRAYEGETKRHNTATEVQAKNELGESKRHNKVMEQFSRKQATASMIQAQASRSQAQTAAKNVEVNARNAESNRIQAEAAALNAKTNAELAEVEKSLKRSQIDKNEQEIVKLAADAYKAQQQGNTERYNTLLNSIEFQIKSSNFKWNKAKDKYGWLASAAGSVINSIIGSATKLATK